MQKEITIDWKDGENTLKGKVWIKRLTFREKNQLEEESTDVKIVNGQPIVKVSTAKMKEFSLIKGVLKSEVVDEKNQPLLFNYEGIGRLPQEVGDMLFEEFTDLNSVDPKKKD